MVEYIGDDEGAAPRLVHVRFYFVDSPPAVDPTAHPDGLQLLERDVFNCASELLAIAF